MFEKKVETSGEAAPAPVATVWLELTTLGGEKSLIRADAIVHLVQYRSGTHIQTIVSGQSVGVKVKETRDEISRRLSEAGARVA